MEHARLDEERQRRLELLFGVRQVALGTDRDELHEGGVVEAQEVDAAVELEEQELVEAAGDEALLIETPPEREVEGTGVQRIEVVQVPAREPEGVDFRLSAVGTLGAVELQLVV